MRVSKNWVKFNKMFTLSPWGAIYVTISADLDENPSIQANPADKAFA